jgi:hypothetical protein
MWNHTSVGEDKERIITWLILRASAMYSGPSCTIAFTSRSSSVSVCVNWKVKYVTTIRKQELLGWFWELQQYVALLVVRFHFHRHGVWWVSEWNEKRSLWRRYEENNYLINFESPSNVLSSLLPDLIIIEIECDQGLCEMGKGMFDRNQERIITRLILIASAMFWAPRCPISFVSRLSVVSVCVKWEEKCMTGEG